MAPHAKPDKSVRCILILTVAEELLTSTVVGLIESATNAGGATSLIEDDTVNCVGNPLAWSWPALN